MVYRIKGFINKRVFDENGKVNAHIKPNLLTNDMKIFITDTNKAYSAKFKATAIKSEGKRHSFHQYIIMDSDRTIAMATVSFRFFNNIKSCEFTYEDKHYVIKAANRFLIDMFEVYEDGRLVATTSVRSFFRNVKSDEITDPLLICIFFIFSFYIFSEHDISVSG